MNVVMIIPTGLGCEIGGHAGDACPSARILAACCDRLIIHPNVVNGSDLNEMTDNMLYVEGSMLDRFLEGKIRLKEVMYNRIILAVNPPIRHEYVNSASAARSNLGAEVSIVALETPLILRATTSNNDGTATGDITGWKELVAQLSDDKFSDFDALAISTPVDVDESIAREYVNTAGVNPWGGVEAMASRLISEALDMPVAHAPCAGSDVLDGFNEVVDPRMSAEFVSISYIHCILKGLHKAPRPIRNGSGLSFEDVDCLISPAGCWGRPHHACLKAGIPVVCVRENHTAIEINGGKPNIFVDNYLEAVGVIMAMKSGVSIESIRRPLSPTEIIT